MSATPQDKKNAEDKPDLESDKKTSEAKKEPSGVPVGEHVEMRQKLREVSDELAETKARLAQFEARKEPANPEPPQWVKEPQGQVKGIKDENRIAKTKAEYALDDAQAKEVLAFLDRNPDTEPQEAIQLLATRKPDVFKGREESGSGQPQYGSLRPTPSSQPPVKQPSDYQQRIEFMKKNRAVNKQLVNKIGDNILGGMLAKTMGWEHKKLTIQK